MPAKHALPRLGPFARAVRRIVRSIPRGRVLSYGEVALRAGRPGGARAVVRALHQLDDVPWWRVVRKGGTLAPLVAREQAQLLAAEGHRARPGKRARQRAR
jgi:methylated-DNA-protein-cysteine methyltransferase-like protein